MLKEITSKTLYPILKLDVTPAQQKSVAPNAYSISEAHFEKNAWFRGIYEGDTAVGFVMLYLDKEKPEYWVWRMMIDKNHQGKGYGKQAMQEVIEFVRTLPNARQLCLSYVPGEGCPAPFYKKVGFVDTGEFDDSGTEIIMKYHF